MLPLSSRSSKLQRGDIVIWAKLDRLFRSTLDALKVVESLKTRGVKLHFLDLGGDIAGNGLSKLFLTIAPAFAEAERDRIRERIGQVKADQKARGAEPVSVGPRDRRGPPYRGRAGRKCGSRIRGHAKRGPRFWSSRVP
jgi:DNA invertase Pin-like site-specific DNA recombinase